MQLKCGGRLVLHEGGGGWIDGWEGGEPKMAQGEDGHGERITRAKEGAFKTPRSAECSDNERLGMGGLAGEIVRGL
eukprot:SAG11_NODE_1139_length_5714_cov_20.900267_1_plen_76_part_00